MKPDTKLKQWCYEQALNSMGQKLPFLTDTETSHHNKDFWIELNKRAKEIYQWVK
jgi:hypothetical protein